MKITAWRIVKAKYAATAFDGEGAALFGGRWNTRGTRVVYTAGSQALAVLEMLVHLDASDLLKHYRLIPVSFSPRLVTTPRAGTLPLNWRGRPIPSLVRAIGDDWVRSGRSAVLRLPSVIVPAEDNYLLNVAHSDFSKIAVGRPQAFRFDPRLR